MLVILKEPIQNIEVDVLAVNLNAFDTINILKLDNKFQLVILKHFDGHFSNQSQVNCPLETFDTYKECLGLFQELLDALKTGEAIFDLRPRKNPSTSSKKGKKQGSGYN